MYNKKLNLRTTSCEYIEITVDLEYKFFCVLNFRVFLLSRIPTKNFWQWLYVPRFGDLEQDNARQENVEYKTVCCVRGNHVAVGELLVWEREPN